MKQLVIEVRGMKLTQDRQIFGKEALRIAMGDKGASPKKIAAKQQQH